MTNQKPNRRKCREAAFQVLYCQSFSDKELLSSVAAVETVRTIEDLKAAAAALRQTLAATEAALRAVDSTVEALTRAATPEGRQGLKPTPEDSLATRLHLADVRRAAVNQMRQTSEVLKREDPLFASDSFTLRLLEAFDRNEQKVNSILSRSLEGWTMRRLTAEDGAALRLGITELVFFEDVPPAVVIDEYVDMIKSYGDKDSPRLVNGVLDRVRKDHRA